jgi:hypothetical protein
MRNWAGRLAGADVWNDRAHRGGCLTLTLSRNRVAIVRSVNGPDSDLRRVYARMSHCEGQAGNHQEQLTEGAARVDLVDSTIVFQVVRRLTSTSRTAYMRFSSRLVLLLAALTPLPLMALDANTQVGIERIQKFASLQVTALKLALAADQASAGNAYAFDELMSLQEQGAKLIAGESGGDPQFTSFIRAWRKLDTDIAHVIEGKDAMLAATSAEAEFVDKMPGLSARVEDAARLIPDRKGSGSQVELVRHLMTLPERMRRRITNIVTGDDTIVVSEADGLLRDITFYGIALDAVINGNKGLGVSAAANEAARKSLQEVLAQWPDVEVSAKRVIDAAPMIESLRQAADEARGDGNSAVSLALPLMRAQ